MRTAISRIALYGKGLFLAVVLIAASAPAALADSDKPWTAIGSDATSADGNVTFTGNIAYLDGNSTVLRYNVVAVDGLVDAGPALGLPRMTVRFRDNGNNGRVIARLRQVPLDGGNSVQLLVLDSNDYPGSSSFQTRTQTGCGDDAFTFDFANNAYYIEVTMTRTGLPVTPGLASLKLDLEGACFAIS
jgi:hypothetical protein